MKNQNHNQQQDQSEIQSLNVQESSDAPVKSLSTFLTGSLAKETQVNIDELIDTVSGYFRSTKQYVQENPKESAMVAFSVGIAAWTLFKTKPGRHLVEKGTAILMPQISNWLSETFFSAKKDVTADVMHH